MGNVDVILDPGNIPGHASGSRGPGRMQGVVENAGVMVGGALLQVGLVHVADVGLGGLEKVLYGRLTPTQEHFTFVYVTNPDVSVGGLHLLVDVESPGAALTITIFTVFTVFMV